MPYYKVGCREKPGPDGDATIVPDVDVEYRIIRPLRPDGFFVVETKIRPGTAAAGECAAEDPVVKSHTDWWLENPEDETEWKEAAADG
ncbi:MAG TPA: hypothetical protein PLQ76_02800 [bacterium]|nr:hypothetical protein [bacterium]